MQAAYICGVGMTPFARFPQRTLKDLSREAVEAALTDAGIGKEDLQAAYCANAMAGIVTGQESIRGQVVLNALGITGIPVVNVENACASGATAAHQGWLAVERNGEHLGRRRGPARCRAGPRRGKAVPPRP